MLSSMAHVDRNIIKTHLNPALPNFMKAFTEILQVPTAQVFHPALKIEVLKCLTEVARSSPRSLQAFLGDILGPVWATLTETAAVYVKTQVNNTEDLDTDFDSDGESRSKRLREIPFSAESQLLSYICLFRVRAHSCKFPFPSEQYIFPCRGDVLLIDLDSVDFRIRPSSCRKLEAQGSSAQRNG